MYNNSTIFCESKISSVSALFFAKKYVDDIQIIIHFWCWCQMFVLKLGTRITNVASIKTVWRKSNKITTLAPRMGTTNQNSRWIRFHKKAQGILEFLRRLQKSCHQMYASRCAEAKSQGIDTKKNHEAVFNFNGFGSGCIFFGHSSFDCLHGANSQHLSITDQSKLGNSYSKRNWCWRHFRRYIWAKNVGQKKIILVCIAWSHVFLFNSGLVQLIQWISLKNYI